MAYFDCIVGGSGKGNTLVVTCADDLAGATITCTNGTKTYTKTCPSTAPYEVTFYGLAAGTYTVSATVSGNTYTTTVVVVDCAALLGGFNWRTWVDTARFLDSTDYDSLSEVLADELAVRELCLEHACVDYLADIATTSADVETIIENDLFAKWVNNSDYALDFLGANVVIKALMDEANKYFLGEWALMPQVPTMTANNAPYGEVIFSDIYGSGYEAYKAFDGVATTRWNGKNSVSNNYIGYHFATPTCIKLVHIDAVGIGNDKIALGGYKIQGSNDNFVNDIHDLYSGDTSGITWQEHIGIDVYLENTTEYEYYRLYSLGNPIDTALDSVSIWEIQFYAWAPKGNVPIMTANNAPYGEASFSGGTVSNPAYIAFNGDTINSCTASGAQSLTYKFTNPVNVKRIKWIPYQADGSQTFKAHTVTFYGSNDNSTWTPLGSKEVAVTDKTNLLTLDIPSNTDYYLYYKATPNQANAGNYTVFCSLQYYGRELSVSVPTMTSDTTPYGTSVASSQYDANTAAWKAFSNGGTYSSNYTADFGSGQWVQYTFPSKMVPKVMTFKNVTDGNYSRASSFKVLASNDNFVSENVEIASFTDLAAGVLHILSLDNSDEYKAIRVFATQANNTFNRGSFKAQYLQFYGLDYSEKEFEAGTTKKWLYDHGVELETMSITSATKGDNEITLSATNAETRNTTAFDLTPYSLLRGKVGSHASGTSKLREWKNGAYSDFTINNMPNTNALDISSINEVTYVGALMSSAGVFDLTELWVE